MSNNDYTKQVISEGVQAVRRRRDALRYGDLNRTEALGAMAAGADSPDITGADSQGYQDWMRARGIGNTDYPVSVGQHAGGKYNGFDTEGQLRAAVDGAADRARMSDRDRAQAMAALLSEKMDGIDKQYQQGRDAVPTRWSPDEAKTIGMRSRSATPEGAASLKADAVDQADVAAADEKVREYGLYAGPKADPNDPYLAKLKDAAAADHAAWDERTSQKSADDAKLTKLDDWYAKAAGTLTDGQELAQQIGQTPLRQYEGIAAGQYGVDPDIAAGWSPESSDLGDFQDQRDLDSEHQFGMPYSEYRATLGDMQTEQDKAAKQQTIDDTTAADDDVYKQTSFSAADLASKSDIPKDQLGNYVNSPEFQSLSAQIEDAIAGSLDDKGQVGDDQAQKVSDVIDEALNAAHEVSPALARLLNTMYGDRLI